VSCTFYAYYWDEVITNVSGAIDAAKYRQNFFLGEFLQLTYLVESAVETPPEKEFG